MNIRKFEAQQPQIHSTTYIDPAAVIIGAVTIGPDCSFWPGVIARGDVNTILIGARTNVQDGTVLHVTHDGPYTPGGVPLIIGDDVTVGHMALLHACTVGNRCLIGMRATVMDKAVIEDDVLLAAGALVPPGKVLESGYLYRGSPAEKIRPLTEDELSNLKYSAEHYVRVKNRHANSN